MPRPVKHATASMAMMIATDPTAFMVDCPSTGLHGNIERRQ
jgi:hypothetical protein